MHPATLLMAAVLTACAAGGSKADAPSLRSDDPPIAAAITQPVRPFTDDDVRRIGRFDNYLPRSRKPPFEAVVAQVAAALGRPALVDPARAQAREVVWARIDGHTCSSVEVSTDSYGPRVIARSAAADQGFPEAYWSCVDAARGIGDGRRFARADIAFSDDPDHVEASLAPLGSPLREERGGEVRRLWAARNDDRCWSAVVSADGGRVRHAIAVAVAGTPAYARCSDWASGTATDAWSADLLR